MSSLGKLGSIDVRNTGANNLEGGALLTGSSSVILKYRMDDMTRVEARRKQVSAPVAPILADKQIEVRHD